MLFEVELLNTPDLPKLQTAIRVIGRVKSTPRYGTKGEVWADGVLVERDFDTTLPDRFIINTTEEKAIALSMEPWVQWIAPMLEGTEWVVLLLPIVISLISGTLGTLLTMWSLS